MTDRNATFIAGVVSILKRMLKRGYTGNITINVRDGVGDLKVKENRVVSLEELRNKGAI
jgi:hypothetical protein